MPNTKSQGSSALCPAFSWFVTVDGLEMSDTPLELIKAGQFKKVPTLLGHNAREGVDLLPLVVQAMPNASLPLTKEDGRELLSVPYPTLPCVAWASLLTPLSLSLSFCPSPIDVSTPTPLRLRVV